MKKSGQLGLFDEQLTRFSERARSIVRRVAKSVQMPAQQRRGMSREIWAALDQVPEETRAKSLKLANWLVANHDPNRRLAAALAVHWAINCAKITNPHAYYQKTNPAYEVVRLRALELLEQLEHASQEHQFQPRDRRRPS